MRHVLVVSPHRASRELLLRFLAEPEVKVRAAEDADAALSSIASSSPPAVVVVDLRRPDEDHPLFLALLRKRHPGQPVIALVPGSLRVFDGSHERVRDMRSVPESAEGLHQLLCALKESLDEVLAQHLLRVFRPPVGRA